MVEKWGMVALLAAGSFWFSGNARAQFTGNLTVEVSGLQSQEGNVCFKVFSGSPGFPNDNDSAVTRACVAIADNLPEDPEAPFAHTFEDLEAGSYGVAIYHDSNGDEQLNRGALGIPVEGYGFSNDAPAVTGPARFEDAVFFLGNNTTVPIQMRYPQ
ncbi:DUF2141 domain-containing protein [Cyanobacteria bacterium FACHB-471]|nr:DUF2141 domain-containing protein [Cyanobacteria bacterium FACHB-471]